MDEGTVVYEYQATTESIHRGDGMGETDIVVTMTIGDIVEIKQGRHDFVILHVEELNEIVRAVNKYID